MIWKMNTHLLEQFYRIDLTRIALEEEYANFLGVRKTEKYLSERLGLLNMSKDPRGTKMS